MSAEGIDFASRYAPEVAQALVESTLAAPYSSLLGIRVVEFTPGSVTCELPYKPQLDSGIGAVHGGAIASLIDHSLSLAVYPLVEKGKWVATAEFKLNYLKAAREGTLKATARVLSLRRSTAVARVDVEQNGGLVAAAQGTLHVRDY